MPTFCFATGGTGPPPDPPTARREPIPAPSIARHSMQTYIVHSSTGTWRLMAQSLQAARLTAAELEPAATILRIEREGQW
jgi:hypothetical protein